MASKSLVKGFKRSALTVALGLCFVGGVQAQSAAGSIFGDTTTSASVQIENLDTGLTRQITADASGRFTFPQLQPGRYRVTSGGSSREVRVNVGTGTPVNFVNAAGDATTLGTVTVVGTGAINPIDVSSVESTSIFTAEQIADLPVGRDITNVALLAPGTVRGDGAFGNLASFGGSSVAENGYYINGFDVTNLRKLIAYANLPFDAIGEQQVKTGGYGAEYGRSLGGVINVITKRGTNEWKAGVSAYWTPNSLREEGKDVESREPGRLGGNNRFFVYRSANEFDQLSYNIWGGGPIIKDRLFVFGLLEGRKNENDTYTRLNSRSTYDNSPNGMIKLDWSITDDHLVEFTGIHNKTDLDIVDYRNEPGTFYTGIDGAETTRRSQEDGGQVYILKYTGFLTDNFTVSAQAGRLENANGFITPFRLPGFDCPAIYDSRAPLGGGNPLVPRGCFNEQGFTVRDVAFGTGPEEDIRKGYRLDAEWRLGDHNLRFGFDKEKFESSHAGLTYSGGIYYRYFSAGNLFGPANASLGDVVRVRELFTESGNYEVLNSAAYIEDSWQATDNFLLYGGVRAETFENKNAAGVTFIESDTLLAPRLGFSWDVNGDSTFKVFANAGRYYIPVAANTNIRASSAEYSSEAFYFLNGVNPGTFTPIIGGVLIPLAINGSRTPPDPRTVAATNLDPMHQDEYIVGFQRQLGSDWSLGMRGIQRKVRAGMDDYCGHDGFNRWAASRGFNPDFALDHEGIDMATCAVINPGRDVSLALDPDNNGTLEVYTVPNSFLGLPKYNRKYHALEVFFEKSKSNNWYMQGSYTLSKSRGNVEGYVNSTLEQDDAGLTQDFDFAAFEDGAYGYLPNDRRHSLKLFGVYDITEEWMVSANFLLTSGRPVNCNGYIPLTAPSLGIGPEDRSSLGNYGGSSFYCLDPNGSLVDTRGTVNVLDDNRYRLGNRGDQGRTPWTRSFDLGVGYTPNWAGGKLNLQMKVFNVLNSQTVTEYNEASQVSRASRVTSPDFLNDVNYQAPRAVRLSLRYEF